MRSIMGNGFRIVLVLMLSVVAVSATVLRSDRSPEQVFASMGPDTEFMLLTVEDVRPDTLGSNPVQRSMCRLIDCRTGKTGAELICMSANSVHYDLDSGWLVTTLPEAPWLCPGDVVLARCVPVPERDIWFLQSACHVLGGNVNCEAQLYRLDYDWSNSIHDAPQAASYEQVLMQIRRQWVPMDATIRGIYDQVGLTDVR